MERMIKKLKSFGVLNFAIAAFLLSWAFSFVYTINFPKDTVSPNSFLLYNIYLLDITTLILIFLLFKKGVFKTVRKVPLFILLLSFGGYAFLSCIWSGSPLFSGFLAVKMFLLITASIGLSILLQKSREKRELFKKIIISIGIAEGLIAIFQFILQHSIGLHLLGESYLSSEVLGAARFWIGDFKLLRSYGTFPHPNILGGFLLFTLAVTWWRKERGKRYYVFVLIQLLGLFLTFSRTAAVGLLLLVLINWMRKQRMAKAAVIAVILLSSLLVIRGTDSSILHSESAKLRIAYTEGAYNRFVSSPVIGRGWGTGPEETMAFSNFTFYPWEKQPVHNIFLLILSDLGVIGLILFLAVVAKIIFSFFRLPYPFFLFGSLFIIYLLIGFFDHYLLTLPQGIAIFFASAALSVPLIGKKVKLRRVKSRGKSSR